MLFGPVKTCVLVLVKVAQLVVVLTVGGVKVPNPRR
jgi:hypothetical protein